MGGREQKLHTVKMGVVEEDDRARRQPPVLRSQPPCRNCYLPNGRLPPIPAANAV